jgi:redox-sensitive bicupin YhaK (pirin superfamily)
MNIERYPAKERGHANHGWLDTHHTFSFAGWFNPLRVHFGALRVLNDDTVKPGEGFGTHPHDNMEIVSIPLHGDMQHKDSMGNGSIIHSGEVQCMSAGTGILHSEFNAHEREDLGFFQIWVLPNQEDVKPRYQQQKYDLDSVKNGLVQLASPNPDDAGLWIHQDAWFSMGKFGAGKGLDYKLHKPGNGVFVMTVEGAFRVESETLDRRDAVGVTQCDSLHFEALQENAQILLIEVPMGV